MPTLSVFNPCPSLTRPTQILFEAIELHEKGYVVAAAVTSRAALEMYVRMLFEIHELQPDNSKAGRRLHGRLALLKREGILEADETRAAFRAIEVGNQAAHGFDVADNEVYSSILDLCEVVKGGVL